MDKVVLSEKPARPADHWSPRIVARYNGNDVVVVRVQGPLVWHSHPETDDPFLVLAGRVDTDMRDRTVTLGPGEPFMVPAGVEHRSVAQGEAQLLVIEPAGTPNTGDPATAVAKPEI